MKNKKVGLCVCYDTKNFGSQLQVLATQHSVEKLGYDYEIIIYKKTLSPLFVMQSFFRLFNPYFIRGKLVHYKRKKSIARHPEVQKQVSIRNKRFVSFVEKYFTKMSKPYAGFAALKKGSVNYDTILTGSDQLWLPQNLGSHFFTQEFVSSDVNKIAYAPSFGVSQIPWFQKRRTAKYLKRFNALSSRELRGSEIIKELTGIDAATVCDPTLLLSGEEWFEVIPDKVVIEKPYIFAYFLGDNINHREETLKLAKETGLTVVTVPFLDNFVESDLSFGDYQMYDIDSSDFVNLIRNAEYICTDSFHGSVFSILNHKKFVTFSRFSDQSKGSRNSRIDSLFELTGLKDRHCKSDVVKTMMNDIDYNTVDKKLINLRKESIEFLNNALKQC